MHTITLVHMGKKVKSYKNSVHNDRCRANDAILVHACILLFSAHCRAPATLSMKILIYSWTPYRDELHRGGGAASYIDRVIDQFAGAGRLEIVHLSSGTEYESGRRTAFCRQLKDKNGVRCFSIVNSPVLAPAHLNATNASVAVTDTSTRDLLITLLQEEGPFDAIHFNNFEGISYRSLEIKQQFPAIRIVVSLHDYYPFCPQVKLWKNGARNCDGSNEGRDCVSCPTTRASASAVLQMKKLLAPLKSLGLANDRTLQKVSLGTALYLLPALSGKTRSLSRRSGRSLKQAMSSEDAQRQANGYRDYLHETRRLLNEYADRVLAVSNRVREIAVNSGLHHGKVSTEYIGTRYALSGDHPAKPMDSDSICIAYLGYASREKGFFFLLECLRALPAQLARKIHLVIAARGESNWITPDVNKLGERFLSYNYYNGYAPDSLPEILAPVHLGLVPVLWEDNLPQVALEFVGHGIPVLTSSLGGAQEIGNTDAFVFEAGNISAFIDRLSNIQGNYPQLREQFFRSLQKPPTVPEHNDRLLYHYRNTAAPSHTL